mmetsp:Transcript_19701/g.45325  ORF Transcript_19701/g.45325 Transcript_19701/m.45325 type:complete len:257 (-) Transcript_19701:377-1147(-)
MYSLQAMPWPSPINPRCDVQHMCCTCHHKRLSATYAPNAHALRPAHVHLALRTTHSSRYPSDASVESWALRSRAVPLPEPWRPRRRRSIARTALVKREQNGPPQCSRILLLFAIIMCNRFPVLCGLIGRSHSNRGRVSDAQRLSNCAPQHLLLDIRKRQGRCRGRLHGWQEGALLAKNLMQWQRPTTGVGRHPKRSVVAEEQHILEEDARRVDKETWPKLVVVSTERDEVLIPGVRVGDLLCMVRSNERVLLASAE